MGIEDGDTVSIYDFEFDYYEISKQKPAAVRLRALFEERKEKRRKRGLGKSLIMSIRANRVRTVNGRKRNCEHFTAAPHPATEK
ncbi:MAG: hypothetical protein ACLS3C_08945 [Oscillospiraceae bacterium]